MTDDKPDSRPRLSQNATNCAPLHFIISISDDRDSSNSLAPGWWLFRY